MASFEGKVVIITGASAGIGEACARQFVAQGAKVVLAARSKEPLDQLAKELGAEKAIAIATDVADPKACETLVAQTLDRFGAVDILVNNAGYNSRGCVQDVPAKQLLQIVDVNLKAPIQLTRLVLPHMLERGSGAVVNVASLAGRVPLEHEATYSATKFGLRAFTFSLAEELRGTNVTASAVSPGPVETGFIMEDIRTIPNIVFSQPMSSADEIAAMVLACAADGRVERVKPAVGAKLATAGYLFPSLRRAIKPMLERKGDKAKARFAAKHGKPL